MQQIYTWRVDDKLAANAIMSRLNADHATHLPADPAAGWTHGGVAAMLRNTLRSRIPPHSLSASAADTQC